MVEDVSIEGLRDLKTLSCIFFCNVGKNVSFVLADTACPRGFARIKGVTCEGEYVLENIVNL